MENVDSFYWKEKLGRKSKYADAKEILEKVYLEKKEITIKDLAKMLRVSYYTARNYFLKFSSEELGENKGNFYQYKKN